MKKKVISGLVALLSATSITMAENPKKSITVYLQTTFPKQTETNKEIKEINKTTGTNFKTWDDVTSLNIGVQWLKDINERIRYGVQIDYSRGSIDGYEQDGTINAGGFQLPAKVWFKQEYTNYTDLLAALQLQKKREKTTYFAGLSIGIAYEKDITDLVIKHPYGREKLRVENNGVFPICSILTGVDVMLSTEKKLFMEAGILYTWGRLRHKVKPKGNMINEKITVDSDMTGPGVWIGIGKKF